MTRVGFGIIRERFLAMKNLEMYKKLLSDAKSDGVLNTRQYATQVRLLEERGIDKIAASVGFGKPHYGSSAFHTKNYPVAVE